MPTRQRLRTIDDLSRKLRQWERSRIRLRDGGIDRALSTGIAPLDDLLPEQGVPPGTLVECLGEAAGGSETLAMMIAARVMGDNGTTVIIDRGGSFYPPAATPWINDLQRMLLVHPNNDRDAVWALEQSLRCSGVSAVVCWLEKLSQQAWRRLQLAGEAGGGVGLLLRSARQRSEPSWAGVRLLVEALGRTRGKRISLSPTNEFISQEVILSGGEGRGEGLHAAPLTPTFSPAAWQKLHGSSSAGERELQQEPSPGRRIRIELIHCRGRGQGGSVELEIDDETGDVHLAPAVAHPARRLRATS